MNKEAFEKIAEGHRLIQEGYLELANVYIPELSTPTSEDKPKVVEQPKSEISKDVIPRVTLEDVRAVLAVKTRDGKTQQVKALLNQFGAEKLSSVPEEKLAELKAKAEVL